MRVGHRLTAVSLQPYVGPELHQEAMIIRSTMLQAREQTSHKSEIETSAADREPGYPTHAQTLVVLNGAVSRRDSPQLQAVTGRGS